MALGFYADEAAARSASAAIRRGCGSAPRLSVHRREPQASLVPRATEEGGSAPDRRMSWGRRIHLAPLRTPRGCGSTRCLSVRRRQSRSIPHPTLTATRNGGVVGG
ncbi:unnamed protein product [Urochloa humidicola]